MELSWPYVSSAKTMTNKQLLQLKNLSVKHKISFEALRILVVNRNLDPKKAALKLERLKNQEREAKFDF